MNAGIENDIVRAVDAAKARYPWLSQVIGGCLVGWPDLTIPPIVYQALMVKVAEAIDEHFDSYASETELAP